MAETFAFSITATLLGKISTPIFEELSLVWGIKEDLQRLKNTMSSVYAVLLDAQEKQETNHQLRDWLGKLNEALYDAEIVLDEFEMDGLRRKVYDQNIARKVSNFFTPKNQVVFRFKMAYKIKKIRDVFDEVAANRNKFNLIERFEERVLIRRDMTHSFIQPEDVIGRDNDIEDVVMFLLEENDHEKVTVLPIVGLGGMGKTALSKMVFNDKRVHGNFDLRLWQCISEDFDLQLIVRKILKSLGIESCDTLELEQLQNRLREKLHGKKYFLILDDVWNENRVKWIELKNLLIGGAKGSKIIVTTRSKSIASFMSTNGCSKEIKGLTHDESLSLFLKWSFRSVQDSEKHPKLVEIAKEIVKKCKGVPLAMKTLGNTLYLNKEIRDWVNVRDNDIWKIEQKEDDILPALKLSYNHLPIYLRRCFSFCSLFPKDHLFDSNVLINCWSANGLLIKLNYSEDLEIVGRKYIEQLWSIGFFQEFQEREGRLEFKMHDLVHDLALLAAEPGIVFLNSQEAQQDRKTRKMRHLSFTDNYLTNNENYEIPSWLLKQKDVRTIYFMLGMGPKMTTFIQTCISEFKHLHFFKLRYSEFKVLPNSIGSLKHLRYLDLAFNDVITSLPDSICELVGLEVLYFHCCWKIKKLPEGLGKLTRLTHLGLTTKEMLLPEQEFRHLTSLRTLNIAYCPNIKSLFSDNVMLCFSSLRELSVVSCDNLESLPVRGLRQLPRLENLEIIDCTRLQLNNSENDLNSGNELLDLRILELRDMPEVIYFPLWLIKASKNLKTLTIDGFPNLTDITLERIAENSKYLKVLVIISCPGLSSLPDGMQSLTLLNQISLDFCPGLVRRCLRDIGEDWGKISHVPNIYLEENTLCTLWCAHSVHTLSHCSSGVHCYCSSGPHCYSERGCAHGVHTTVCI